MAKVSVTMPKADSYIQKIGFGKGGKIQRCIDSEIVRLSDPYVPSDTTATRKSVYKNSVFGSGEIIYDAYGKEDGRNIWNDTRESVRWQDAPMRGPKWVLRAMEAGGYLKLQEAINALLRKSGE